MANIFFPTTDNLISGVFVATFGCAPGATYLSQARTLGAVATAQVLINASGAQTPAALAALVMGKLGVTTAMDTNSALLNYLTGVFTTAGVANSGQALVDVVTAFPSLGNHPVYSATYGTAADAFAGQTNTATAYSTVATNSSTDLAVLTAAVGTAGVVSGQTFTLTTGSNNLVGTAGADTFDAGLSTGSLQTLNSGDRLDGGAGTDDLIAVINSAVTPTSLANIENILLTGTGLVAASVDLTNATGVTSVTNQASTMGLTISGVSKATAVTVRDTAIAGQTVAYNDVTGAADAATISLLNIATGATLTVAGVETLTLASGGSAANVLTSVTAASATTLNITGTQGINVGSLAASTAITKIDASGNTSTLTGVTAAFSNTASAHTVVGGAGNDSFTMGSGTGNDNVSTGAGTDTIIYTANFTTNDTVDGGAGTDTLRATHANLVTASATTPTTYKVTNVETIQATETSAANTTLTVQNISATATRLNLAHLTGTNVTGGGDTVVGGAGSFTLGLGSSSLAATGALGGALTVNDTGTATTDSLTITNSETNSAGQSANVYNARNITVNGYETVTINTGSVTGTANTLGTVTVTGDVGGTAAETVKFTGANTVSVGVITADIVDASALTAAGTAAVPTITMVTGSTATTVTGSGGIDILYGRTTTASSVDGGAGNDSVYGGSGADTLLGGVGDDTITSGSGNDNIDAGDGDDTVQMQGNLATGDTVNGGLGTDTLTATTAIDAAGASTISNFEVIEFSGTVAQAMTSFLNMGVTKMQTSNGSLTVTSAQDNLVDLVITTGAVTPSLTRLVDSSTANKLNVTFHDDAGAITLTTPSFNDEETLVIGETGDNAAANVRAINLGAAVTGDLKSITFTGNNNHTATLAASLLATVDASTATGTLNLVSTGSAVNMTVTGPAGAALTVVGGSGNDVVNAGNVDGNNLSGGSGADTLNGGSGTDTLDGGLGADIINGGGGSDTYSSLTGAVWDTGASAVSTGVAVNLGSTEIAANAATLVAVGYLSTGLTAGVASNTAVWLGLQNGGSGRSLVSSNVDTLSSIENVTGSDGADYIVGSSAANVITGGAARDYIAGGSGDDVFIIAAAADHAANESIVGGAGNDTIIFTSAAAATLTLDAAVTDADAVINVVIGTAAGLTTGVTAENVTAAALAGTLAVNLTGNDGANTLTGTANADTITGGAGGDIITGGAGIDAITGGTGADTFVMTAALVANADNISDFTVAQADILAFSVAGMGLNAADYAAGAVTIINAAAGNALAAAAATNHIIVDTIVNIAAMVDADSAWNAAGGAIAIASDTGNIYWDADADFSAGLLIVGSITAAQAALLANANLSIVA